MKASMKWLALILVLALPGMAAAQGRSDALQGVAEYFDEQGQAGFSGAILVASGGKVLERAYGLADREWNIPNHISARFRIGSLTKQFTAAAVALLAVDGRLSLDDPICNYIDDCPPTWRPIRISQLLNHSSGITDFVRLPGMRERFTLPARLEDTVELLAAQPLDFAPGTDSRYGNSGYLLAAHIIQRVSGKSYEQFLAERIYQPLTMHSSGYANDAPIISRRARGYVTRNGRVENAPFIDMSIPIGAGSQYSTVGDLYRWDRALRTDQLLPREMRDRVFAGGLGGYGYGWEIAEDHGHAVAEHNGDINGFGAYIARYLKDDAVIIILTNMEGTKVRAMKDAIAAKLFTSR